MMSEHTPISLKGDSNVRRKRSFSMTGAAIATKSCNNRLQMIPFRSMSYCHLAVTDPMLAIRYASTVFMRRGGTWRDSCERRLRPRDRILLSVGPKVSRGNLQNRT
jgi:hypothetical protein